ncbi:MAG: DUF1350 family protein [Cyanobacteria bacterium P01_B01_bin.77]
MFFIRTIGRLFSIKKIQSINANKIEEISNDKRTSIIYPPPNASSKGVIQFVGGFISGTFPFTFCGYFLSLLAKSGYTVVVYKISPFNLNHFELAFNLLERQEKVREHLKEREEEEKEYLWVAYSIGCKIVTLLEILSSSRSERIDLLERYFPKFCNYKDKQLLQRILFRDYFSKGRFNYIRDQASVFIAPEIRSTYSSTRGIREVQDMLNIVERMLQLLKSVLVALIFRSSFFSIVSFPIAIIISFIFPKMISAVELDLFPNQRRTEYLTKKAFENLFGILGIIGLQGDTISSDDVEFFKKLYSEDKKENPSRSSYFFIKDLVSKTVIGSEIIGLGNCENYTISNGTNMIPVNHNMPCCAIGHGTLLKRDSLFDFFKRENQNDIDTYRPEEKNLCALVIDVNTFLKSVQEYLSDSAEE